MTRDRIIDGIVGFRGGKWVDPEAAGEILDIVWQHIVAEFDKRIAREQMGGGYGVVVDELESLRSLLPVQP